MINKMTKIGYKVIQRYKMESCFAIDSIKYKINKKVYRKMDSGGLCVFDTFFHAESFTMDLYELLDVYLCEYKPETSYPADNHIYQGKKNWDYSITKLKCQLPLGTELARWVKLLRIAEWEKDNNNRIIQHNEYI